MYPTRQSWFKRNFSTIVFFLIFVNILLLDLLAGINLMDKKNKNSTKASAASISVTPNPVTTLTKESDFQDCSTGCPSEIEREIASIKKALSATPRIAKTQAATNPIAIQNLQPTAANQTVNNVKEFFIPLGSGSGTATIWTDVPGVTAEINSSNYSNIKNVLFEVSARVPDANQIVEVRLYNTTDKYAVGNSELLYPSGTTQYFRITAIQLGQGAKTYQVQTKTQLGHNTILDQARIHITTN